MFLYGLYFYYIDLTRARCVFNFAAISHVTSSTTENHCHNMKDKHLCFILFWVCFSVFGASSLWASESRRSTPAIKVQPAFWWSGMHDPHLQIMLHGSGVGRCEVSLSTDAVAIDSVVRPDNANYLLLYVNTAQAEAGAFDIVLRDGKKTRRIAYTLRPRDSKTRAQGFDASDVVYLLMPDRFVNGDRSNDVVKGLKEATSSQEPDARHGGDLAGMTAALDYLADLGVTAIWPTPLLINDMPSTSYHGYAITDYYEVDPRFGGNEAYCRFVDEAHKRGLKVIQDMVFNHCGSDNFLFADRPADDWFNCGSRYVQTSYRISALSDPYAATADCNNATDGWFVEVMPDLNQRNPHVMKYLTQNSIWWIEYAGIDGIRQDTYPYADRRAMAEWNKAVRAEYPHFNIVGETWLGHNVGVSQWQKGSKLAAEGDDSELPTVMDFPLMGLLGSQLDEETNDWDRGLARIYEYLSQDAVYADPTHLLTFLDNHDTDRFARNAEQAAIKHRYRQALTLLLTLRGIPQLYYGDELAMAGNKSRGDGLLRQDFPLNPATAKPALEGEKLTATARATYDFTRRLLRWRKGNKTVTEGRFKHYAIQHGCYVYARQDGGKTVTVIMNGTDHPVCLPLKRYAEVLPSTMATDVITGRTVKLDGDCLQLGVRDILILEF